MRIFPYLILILSLSRIIAVPLGSPWLDHFGRLFAIAPLPKPFQSLRTTASDSSESRIAFRCYEGAEAKDWVNWNHELHAQIQGPHRRYVVFLNFVASLQRYNAEPYLPILRRGLCEANAFGSALGCSHTTQIHARFPIIANGRVAQMQTVALPCE